LPGGASLPLQVFQIDLEEDHGVVAVAAVVPRHRDGPLVRRDNKD